MKNKNLKLKNILAASLMVTILGTAPLVTFAKNENKGNFQSEVRVESKVNANKGNRFGNFFRNIFGKKVNAQANANVRATLTPSISGITSPTLLEVGQEGTWKVKASDPKNGSLEYMVEWGDENLLSRMMAKQAFVQTSTFTHTYAKAGDYTVKFTVKNEAGLKTSSSATVHVVPGKQTAPAISNLKVESIKSGQVTLSWNTNVKSSSMVWYDTNSSVDTDGEADVSSAHKTKNHKIHLKGLEASTKYYVVVGSGNGNEDVTMSQEISFTTLANGSNSANPVIKSLSGPETVKAGQEVTVTVNAMDPKNGSLTYSADWGDSASLFSRNSAKPVLQTATLSHIYAEEGKYTATFTVENELGKKATSSMEITVTAADEDNTNPVISNIQSEVNNDSVTITWTTDEPTTSKVFYSTTSPVNVESNSTARVSDNEWRTEHSMEIELDDLNENTKYYFVVESTDDSDNNAYGSESNFTTAQ